MKRHTTRLLGTAITLGALLVAGVGAAFAANGPASSVVSRMMGRSGPSAMMTGSGTGGMMNGHGTGDVMSGSHSRGMMADWTGLNGKALSIEQARQSIQRYVDQMGNRNLAIDEVIGFQRNFYAVVKDTSTGHGAFEVLVNKVSGAVFPEFGPAMMWNTQYGMMSGSMGAMMSANMSGMMSGNMGNMMGYHQPHGPMTVSPAKAEQSAQRWLTQNELGAVAEAPDQFPGYYTVHFLQTGKVAGMLSVNGYTGQLWHHSWHGKAIQVLKVTG